MIAARPVAKLVRSSTVPVAALFTHTPAILKTGRLPVISVGASPLAVLTNP